MKQNLMKCAAPLLLLVMVLSAYCNTLASPPFLDDFHSFIQDSQIYVKDLSTSSIVALSKTGFGWWRWLPVLTFALNHKLGGGQLMYFHLTNIFVHMIAMLGVFFLACQILKSVKDPSDGVGNGGSYWLAVCIAALWALSPVQTSAVTYLVQRMASMMAAFYILSVGLYVMGRRLRRAGRNSACQLLYAGSFLCGVCAFLSKENAVTLPLMILITELWFFQPDLLSKLLEWLRMTRWITRLLLAAGLIAVLLAGYLVIPKLTATYSVRNFNMYQRLLTEARVVVWYISLLLWPAPSRLSMEHDVVVSTSLLSPPSTLASILFLALLLGSAIRFRRRFPIITYGVVWFFVNLAVESTFLPLELVFEHRLYLPSAGLIVSLVAGVELISRSVFSRIRDRDRLTALCATAMIVASVFTFATFDRNEAWENILSIHLDAAAKAPNNPRAHANLGLAYYQTEQFDKAIQSAEKCLALTKPKQESYMVAANVILISLIRMGDLDRAIERGNQLLQDRPKDGDVDSLPSFCLNLGEANRRQKNLEKAYFHTVQALDFIQRMNNSRDRKLPVVFTMRAVLADAKRTGTRLDNGEGPGPGDISIDAWLGEEFYKYGEAALAADIVKKALAQDPNDPGCQKLSEKIAKEEELNREQLAKWSFTEKYLYHPFSRFNFCMAVAFIIQEKQMPMSIIGVGEKFLDYALTLEPESADAHLLKGWYYYQRNDAPNATSEAQRALELDPLNGKAWVGLGFFLMKAEQNEEAASALNRGMDLYPGYSRKHTIRELAATLLKKGSGDRPEPATDTQAPEVLKENALDSPVGPSS